MANSRYKGAVPDERLSINSLLDADMIQVRHRIGLDGDSDKGVSKAVLQGIPVAICSTGAAVASKFAVLSNCPDFSLVSGRNVLVYFKFGNTVDNPTLNIADTGAVPITSTTGNPDWKGGTWQMFTYTSALIDGVTVTNWVLIQGDTDNVVPKNITQYLLDGSLYPRMLGYGYTECQDLNTGDYFYALGFYDKAQEDTKFKLGIDEDKIFVKSDFGFFPYISHNYYRTTIADLINHDYRFNPLITFYGRIFSMDIAEDMGIRTHDSGVTIPIECFVDGQLTVIKIDESYVKSIDNGITWTEIEGPTTGEVTNVFYEGENIIFRGNMQETCGTTDSSGHFTPMEEVLSDRTMLKWLTADYAITDEYKIAQGFDGSQMSAALTGFSSDSMTDVFYRQVDTLVYTVNNNGAWTAKARVVTNISGTNEWAITFTRNGEAVTCTKLLVSTLNEITYFLAVREEGGYSYLMTGSVDIWGTSSSGNITVPLYDVYNYTKKTTSNMIMRVNPSKMSFKRMNGTSYFCTMTPEGKTSRFIIATDETDSRLIACWCGDVSFEVEDGWDNRFEYNEPDMKLYRLYDTFTYYDTDGYIRHYRYGEFTKENSEVIPISPPEENYSVNADNCDCYIRLI